MTTYNSTTIAHYVLLTNPVSPRTVLKTADYEPHMADSGTDWTRQELNYEVQQAVWNPTFWESQGMVCSKTGYTAKHMLAAMLNDVLAGEIDAEYVRRVDAILNDVWIYPKTVRYYDDLYAQHQSNRYMC